MSLTDSKRNEEVRLGDLALLVEEPLGSKLLRAIPQVRVHVNGVDVRHYLESLRDGVVTQLDIPGGRQGTSVTLYLVGHALQGQGSRSRALGGR